MVDESPTPVTIPNRRQTPKPEAVPEPVPFETTDEVVSALFQGTPADDLIDAFARKLVQHGSIAPPIAGAGAGGDGNGAKHAKSIKRHNWLAVAMAILLGPGGALAVIYATSDRAKANSQEVKHLKDSTKAIEPRIEKTEEEVKIIRVQVGEVKTSMDSVQTQQTDIAAGIEELKKENLNRLKDELQDARRELRRERNR